MRTPVRPRTLLLALLLALPALLATAGVAGAHMFTPQDGGSPNADDISGLYKLTLALAVVVFVGVEGALIYCIVRFRARKGAVPAQIRGNTRLEIGFTVASALVLVVLATVTFTQLSSIRQAPESGANGLKLASVHGLPQLDSPLGSDAVPKSGKSLRIRVNGQQYIWRYFYPDGDRNPLNDPFSYEEMVVPTDTTVTLIITSIDVAHSWWIPELGGKFDAVPGHTNATWFRIPGRLAGTRFRGQCAELCGRGHANMIGYVHAVTPQQYEQYIRAKQADIARANADGAVQRQRQNQQAAQSGASQSVKPTTP